MSNETNLGASIRRGSAWLFVGNTSGQILAFLFGIVLARLLTPQDFGMLVTISVFTGLAGFISGGGMGQALIRAKDVSKEDYDIVFTLQLVIGCMIYTMFFFAAPWFAKWYDTPIYSDLIRVSALSFIFRPFVNLPSSILYRNMRFKERSGASVVALIISSTTSIVMAYTGYGVWSLIIGGICGSAANALMFSMLSKWRPGWSLQFRRARGIARYGLMVSVTDVLDYLRDQVSVFLLSHRLGPASVGLYNKGYSLSKLPHTFITGSVYQVLFRAMAGEQDNLDKCRYLLHRSVALVAVYATPFYIAFLWLAEPLIRGVYGPKWVDAAGPLWILTLAWPFWLVHNLSGAVLAAKNWLHREAVVQALNLTITSLFVLIGLTYGIKGVAYAIVCAYIYSAIHMYWLALKCLHDRWSSLLRATKPAIILNVILACGLFLVDHAMPAGVRDNDLSYLAVMSVTGGILYVLCFLYLPISALETEQRRWKSRLLLIGKTAD